MKETEPQKKSREKIEQKPLRIKVDQMAVSWVEAYAKGAKKYYDLLCSPQAQIVDYYPPMQDHQAVANTESIWFSNLATNLKNGADTPLLQKEDISKLSPYARELATRVTVTYIKNLCDLLWPNLPDNKKGAKSRKKIFNALSEGQKIILVSPFCK